jgi:Sucrose synthase
MQKDYHFSAQFTADLISMNTADFIIASTYREQWCSVMCNQYVHVYCRVPTAVIQCILVSAAEEIAGVKGGVAGQYESHSHFTVGIVLSVCCHI